MNKAATSKEEILQASRELLQESGQAAVNIRSVASKCDVSVGCIYNYFDSKADLIRSTVESIWFDVFHFTETDSFKNLKECITDMYHRMEIGQETYPGFFMLHSMNFEGERIEDGKMRMQVACSHIKACLCRVIQNDPNIKHGTFDKNFTPESFADLLFSLMLSSMLRQNYDPSHALILTDKMVYA